MCRYSLAFFSSDPASVHTHTKLGESALSALCRRCSGRHRQRHCGPRRCLRPAKFCDRGCREGHDDQQHGRQHRRCNSRATAVASGCSRRSPLRFHLGRPASRRAWIATPRTRASHRKMCSPKRRRKCSTSSPRSHGALTAARPQRLWRQSGIDALRISNLQAVLWHVRQDLGPCSCRRAGTRRSRRRGSGSPNGPQLATTSPSSRQIPSCMLRSSINTFARPAGTHLSECATQTFSPGAHLLCAQRAARLACRSCSSRAAPSCGSCGGTVAATLRVFRCGDHGEALVEPARGVSYFGTWLARLGPQELGLRPDVELRLGHDLVRLLPVGPGAEGHLRHRAYDIFLGDIPTNRTQPEGVQDTRRQHAEHRWCTASPQHGSHQTPHSGKRRTRAAMPIEHPNHHSKNRQIPASRARSNKVLHRQGSHLRCGIGRVRIARPFGGRTTTCGVQPKWLRSFCIS